MNTMSNDIGTSVFSEGGLLCTKILTHQILSPFHRFFIDTFAKALEEEPNNRKVLSYFQDLLSQIPEWNIDKVERETTKIITESHCDYMEDIVTAVFVAHVKLLTALRLSNKNKKVQITVPKLNHFIHRSLTECGRLLWSSVFLFQNDITSIEKQKNHRQIENLIKDGIQHAINGLLPIKSILKDSIPDDDEDEEEEAENEAEEVKSKVEEEEAKVEEEVKAEVVEEAKPEVEEVKSKVEEEVKVPEVKEEVKVPEVKEEVKLPEVKEEVKAEEDIPGTKSVSTDKSITTSKSNRPVEVIKEETVAAPPTIIIDANPQVKFADMIHTHESSGEMNYEDSLITDDNDDGIKILDEDAGEISDVEDLDVHEPEDLGIGDFEQL